MTWPELLVILAASVVPPLLWAIVADEHEFDHHLPREGRELFPDPEELAELEEGRADGR